MRTVSLIEKKRDGGELTREEITALIEGYTRGDIPDYQMSAWAMAVYYQGMTERETADLTMAIAHSGETVDLSPITGIKVDKHSTGGVGDTTTLVLGPLVAAAGIPVAKMSGRGLGHTGGTIDKLESIPGFQTDMSADRFIRQVNEIGIAVAGQTIDIAPADKKLYALRDVTGTVASIPLIASSVMSKKIAAGADAIVLDVKTGSGAFMKTLDDALKLAQAMVDIGTRVGRETVAVISNMEQPLGRAVGNALEVKEAIETLTGSGPDDLTQLCLHLGAQMLLVARAASSEHEAKRRLQRLIETGEALDKLRAWVKAQGGDPAVIDDVGQLPQSGRVVTVPAAESGIVAAIDAERIGVSAMMLGAGRETTQSRIDPAVGVVLLKKVGDEVSAGEALAELHVGDRASDVSNVIYQMSGAYKLASSSASASSPLIHAVVSRDGTTYM